jgi:hypothetical protein
MIQVPAQYQALIDQAAAATGLPEQVVAAQINLESDFQPGVTSRTGAEGIAQFEPGTFAAYGPKGGNAYNATDDMTAYANYMNSLLGDFHGNVEQALAAYNAGPGNYKAGLGYADRILQQAGEPTTFSSGAVNANALAQTGSTSAVPTQGSSVATPAGFSLGGILKDFPIISQLDSVQQGFADVISMAQWWTAKLPQLMIRLVELVFGFALLQSAFLLTMLVLVSGTPDSVKDVAAFGIGVALPETRLASIVGNVGNRASKVNAGQSISKPPKAPQRSNKALSSAQRAPGRASRELGVGGGKPRRTAPRGHRETSNASRA